jgi:hypothetical protein
MFLILHSHIIVHAFTVVEHGVQKTSAQIRIVTLTGNIAVLGELGRYPLLLEVILNIFRYFKYLLKSEDVLLSEALKVSKSLKSLNHKLKLNRKRSSLLILLTIDVPHTSLPYNSTGFTVWSNMCKSVFIFGLYKLKLFLNLRYPFLLEVI